MTVPPAAQNFPLIDDWAFARSVFMFARGQGIDYIEWASMPQLGQWLWALPFVAVGGESLIALRISTILLSWVGLWAFDDLLRGEGLAGKTAAFLALTLAVHPIFFLLQGTFMTDVPTLAFCLLALALYRRALAGGRVGTLLAAAGVALLAVGTRQTAVAAPATAALLLWRDPRRRRPLWLASVLVPLAAAGTVHFWFTSRTDVLTLDPRSPRPAVVLLLPFAALVNAGLAAVPVLALARVRVTWRGFILPALVLGGIAWYWYDEGPLETGLFPYVATMLTHLQAFANVLVRGTGPSALTERVRVVLTVVSCLAAAGLVGQARQWRWEELKASPLVIFAGLHLALLLVFPRVYDRYLIPVYPAALMVAAPRRPGQRLAWGPGLAVLAGHAALSVVLTHDWWSWNTARWELGHRAVARGVHPWDIEGGFEWDGWHRPLRAGKPQRFRWQRLTLPTTPDVCPNVTGKFALTFSVQDSMAPLDEEPYSTWLPPGRHTFYFVRYVPPPGATGKP